MARLAASTVAVALLCAGPLAAQTPPPDMGGMPGMGHDEPPAAAAAPAPEGATPDMAAMAGMGHGGHAMPYSGNLGFYPMTRDASGTSWQPDASIHAGLHGAAGDWTLMAHALVNGVYDHQGGPRGGNKAFVAGMAMGAARRDFESGDTLNLRVMLSPDPLMGPRGYPLLLAAGETANGRDRLVDRQHPHDLFMELSTSYSHRLGVEDSLFVYAGLPGEPAFGPPAFMHRASGLDSPEAPITHHWLDSTHITFGVVTAGWVHGSWKLEASRFRGREPDQNRWDIEAPKLDSTAARLSWNPTANLALQGSWAQISSPEALEPAVDERRWSASALYTTLVGSHGLWATTLAWGRKVRSDRVRSDAWLAESAYKPDDAWTVFARVERLTTDELWPGAPPAPGAQATVAKLALGAIHDWRVAGHAKFGLGGLVSFDHVPRSLASAYGSSPGGATGFARLVLD